MYQYAIEGRNYVPERQAATLLLKRPAMMEEYIKENGIFSTLFQSSV